MQGDQEKLEEPAHRQEEKAQKADGLNIPMLNKPLGEALYARLALGDERAFETVHGLYKARLVYYARQLGIEWEAVEDVLSDAFLALWQSRSKLRSDDHLRNFLFLAVRHQAIKQVRARKRHKTFLDNLAFEEQRLETLSGEEVSAQLLGLIAAAVKALPADYKHIYELAFEKEFTPSEIARVLERNPSTIRTQKQRALDMIREWITTHGNVNPVVASGLIAGLYSFYFF